MRVSMDVYTTRTFNKDSIVGYMKMDSIPTTSMPDSFADDRRYRMTNLFEIGTERIEYKGLYFVAQSLLYLDDAHYFGIELIAEKYNDLNSQNLYLKGVITYVKATENFIKIKLTGEIEQDVEYPLLPRTSLDYISLEGNVYECDKVIHNPEGRVEIKTINKMTLEQFRKTGSYY